MEPAVVISRIKKGGTFTEAEIDEAMLRAVQDEQFAMTLAASPIWWEQSPWLRTMSKFTPFAVKQARFVWDHVLGEVRHGNFAPLGRWLAFTLMAGEIHNFARDKMTGSRKSLTANLGNSIGKQVRDAKGYEGNQAFKNGEFQGFKGRIWDNFMNGGGMGILTELFFADDHMEEVRRRVGGPVGGTVQNVLEAGKVATQKPGFGDVAAKDLVKKEVGAVRDAQAIWREHGPDGYGQQGFRKRELGSPVLGHVLRNLGTLFQVRPLPDGMLEVTDVKDGDTFKVSLNGKGVEVRFDAVDTPEKEQPFGPEAKKFTSDRTLGKPVKVTVKETDRYGRLVGRVDTEKGEFLNEELVKNGLAWWYEKYGKHEPQMEGMQAEAKAAKRGLWQQENPQDPGEYRRKGGLLHDGVDATRKQMPAVNGKPPNIQRELYRSRAYTLQEWVRLGGSKGEYAQSKKEIAAKKGGKPAEKREENPLKPVFVQASDKLAAGDVDGVVDLLVRGSKAEKGDRSKYWQGALGSLRARGPQGMLEMKDWSRLLSQIPADDAARMKRLQIEWGARVALAVKKAKGRTGDLKDAEEERELREEVPNDD